MEKATFAGGCFWCTEAIFQHVKGVNSVVSGFAGEGKDHPSYEDIHEVDSGYAEAIQIEFDSKDVTYSRLLEIFFKTHDPTSFDRQGADVGPEYRSIVFYHNEQQKEVLEKLIKELDASRVFPSRIVTEVKPFMKFFKAEANHQNFYNRNKDSMYCSVVINPKLDKLFKEFSADLK